MDEEQLKDKAFELWAFVCNRRMERVREELSAMGEDVALDTLNAWALEGEWAIAIRDRLEEIIPDLGRRTWATMALAEEKAADYMFNVVSGNFFPEVDDWEDVNPALVKVRMEAAKNVMHMTGWSPNATNVKARPVDPYNFQTTKPLASMSDEELKALEANVVDSIMDRKLSQAENVKKRRRGT